jgi:hypothetical protein
MRRGHLLIKDKFNLEYGQNRVTLKSEVEGLWSKFTGESWISLAQHA